MILEIEYSSTTIDLTANGYAILDGFYPQSPSDPEKHITDKVDIWITASSSADMQAKILAINLALQYAKVHAGEASNGVWLNFAPYSDVTAYRSRIYDGVLLYDTKLAAWWPKKRLKVTLVVERAPFWEGAEIAIPLTNGNGVDVDDGLTVYNCNDESGSSPNVQQNYVDIAAGAILGDLAAPAKILAVNTYTDRLYDLWIGHNYTDPTHAVWNYEGEDAAGGSSGADATCSGGNKKTVTVDFDDEETLLTWTLGSAALSAARGQWVHALLRVDNLSLEELRQMYFRMNIIWNLTTIWQSEKAAPSDLRLMQIRDLFTFRLPPWLAGMNDLDGLSLALSGQRRVATDLTIGVDFLQLVPADSFRYIVSNGYGVEQDDLLVDDGILGLLYRMDASGEGRIGIFSGYGEPIQLQPGLAQRLYFLMTGITLGLAAIDQTLSVMVRYRPRRRAL
jgi:hypothetical protein